jgi:hypothetical protein
MKYLRVLWFSRLWMPVLAGLLLAGSSLFAADTFLWNTNRQEVTADIRSQNLLTVLRQVAAATGWHVYVEPDALHPVSAKFQKLPPGQALRLLVGDINFALVPSTNSRSRLYVFRTDRGKATQLVEPASMATRDRAGQAQAIPNQLVVRLKRGASIDELARKLGAKVIGRIDSINAYCLEFDDSASTDSARTELASDPTVESVENNFSIPAPAEVPQVFPANVPLPQLQIDPPSGKCQALVGVVDTAPQSLGKELDPIITKKINIADGEQASSSSPTHATSMIQTILRSYQASTGKTHTSMGIISVNVFGANASTSSFQVAEGVAAAANAGAKIINLSLGSEGESSVLRSVIEDAYKNNILLVASAGNTTGTTPFYPAAYQDVNAVTAVNNGQIASYADYGSFVSLGAPGDSYVSFNGQTFLVQGTSPAAAYISGIAAGYVEANGCPSVSSSQTYLQDSYKFQPPATPQN